MKISMERGPEGYCVIHENASIEDLLEDFPKILLIIADSIVDRVPEKHKAECRSLLAIGLRMTSRVFQKGAHYDA